MEFFLASVMPQELSSSASNHETREASGTPAHAEELRVVTPRLYRLAKHPAAKAKGASECWVAPQANYQDPGTFKFATSQQRTSFSRWA